METWMGIDCGGTVLKAGIYDRHGTEIGVSRTNLQVLSSQPGWAERDMEQLWASCSDVIRDVLTRTKTSPGSIQGIAISAQGKGLFLLDKQQQPLGHGILSSDQRALELVRQWQAEGIPDALYPLTRQTLWTGHPATLLRWIKDHEPERYARIGAIQMAHDFLRTCLTGEVACEETNISESNLYNMAQGSYDPALLQLLGIRDMAAVLPRIVRSSEIAGRVTSAAAVQTGLLAGTPVYGGLFDVVSTALCAGLEDEQTLNAVMGTWSVTSGITTRIDLNQTARFVYGRAAEADQYIVHAASPTSAGNLEWLLRQWQITDYESVNRDVAALPKAGSNLFFVPFLYGSNAGTGMTAGFYGLQALHERPHLLQAIYEGVVFSHMTHLDFLRQRFPQARRIRMTGGPAHSAVWMQMFADISGLTLELPRIEETGCLGAALTAMVGGGEYRSFHAAQQAIQGDMQLVTPDWQAHSRYQQKFTQYQLLVNTLAEFQAASELIAVSGV